MSVQRTLWDTDTKRSVWFQHVLHLLTCSIGHKLFFVFYFSVNFMRFVFSTSVSDTVWPERNIFKPCPKPYKCSHHNKISTLHHLAAAHLTLLHSRPPIHHRKPKISQHNSLRFWRIWPPDGRLVMKVEWWMVLFMIQRVGDGRSKQWSDESYYLWYKGLVMETVASEVMNGTIYDTKGRWWKQQLVKWWMVLFMIQRVGDGSSSQWSNEWYYLW